MSGDGPGTTALAPDQPRTNIAFLPFTISPIGCLLHLAPHHFQSLPSPRKLQLRTRFKLLRPLPCNYVAANERHTNCSWGEDRELVFLDHYQLVLVFDNTPLCKIDNRADVPWGLGHDYAESRRWAAPALVDAPSLNPRPLSHADENSVKRLLETFVFQAQ